MRVGSWLSNISEVSRSVILELANFNFKVGGVSYLPSAGNPKS